MSQTSVDINQPVAVNGLLADASGQPKTVNTFNNPAVEIPFGRMVAKISADDNGVDLPTDAGDLLVGIALRDYTVAEGDATAENAYKINSAVAVLRRGQVYVEVDEAVTPDDNVFVRHTANGGLDKLGVFRQDADTARAVAVPEAKFLTSGSAGELVIVDMNLP